MSNHSSYSQGMFLIKIVQFRMRLPMSGTPVHLDQGRRVAPKVVHGPQARVQSPGSTVCSARDFYTSGWEGGSYGKKWHFDAQAIDGEVVAVADPRRSNVIKVD